MKYLKWFVLSLVLIFSPLASRATEPFTLVTLSGPGSQSDTAARFIAPILSTELSRPVVVMNVPGGQGVIGMQKYLSMRADGNSLLIGNTSIGYAGAKMPHLEFDPIAHLEPVYGLSTSPLLVIVPATSNIYSMRDLQRHGLANGRLLGGSSTMTVNLSMGLMDKQIGTKTEIVNYKQPGELLLNLVTGLIDYNFAGTANSSVQGFIESGKLRPIGIVGATRSAQYPKLPTIAEQGWSPVEDFSWTAFFVNSNTPVNVKKALTKTIKIVMISDDMKKFEELPGMPHRLLLDGKGLRKLQKTEEKAF